MDHHSLIMTIMGWVGIIGFIASLVLAFFGVLWAYVTLAISFAMATLSLVCWEKEEPDPTAPRWQVNDVRPK